MKTNRSALNLPLFLGIAYVFLTIGAAVAYTFESKVSVPLMITAMTALPLALGWLGGRHHEQEKERRRQQHIADSERLAMAEALTR